MELEPYVLSGRLCWPPGSQETVGEFAAPELDGYQAAPGRKRSLDECEWKEDTAATDPAGRTRDRQGGRPLTNTGLLMEGGPGG